MYYLGLAVTNVVIRLVVMLSNKGKAVALSGGKGVGPDMRITKLPMPIQKAMARPATNPTTAPWGGEENRWVCLSLNSQQMCSPLCFWKKKKKERKKYGDRIKWQDSL